MTSAYASKVCAVLLACLALENCASQATLDVSSSGPFGGIGLRNTAAVLDSHNLNISHLNATLSAANNAPLGQQVASGIDDDFSQTLTACQPVFSGFDREASALRWTSFSIAMLGTIAGAVVVPALSAATTVNKVAVAAVGGLSGAANSAQNALNSQGLTSADILTTRNNIQQQFSAALSDYYTARPTNDYDKEITALEKARAACVDYAVQTGAAVSNSK